MKIVSVDKVFIYPEHIKLLEKYGEVIIYKDIPSKDEGIKRIEEAEIVIDNWFDMPAEVIAAAKKLKFISVAATGYEWVDLKEAVKSGVIVSNSPGFSTEAVAEHTIGLLLASSRLVGRAVDDTKKGRWGKDEYRGKELSGKTLGIIGFGTIGRRVGEIAEKGLGMRVLGVTSQSGQDEWDKLLQTSDFISINSPLTEKTKGMIGAKEFDQMKKGVVIVNTGRGAVLDEKSLMSNLKSGKIFASVLDVLIDEPVKNHPLFSLPNVVITPHIAYDSDESRFRLSEIQVENITAFVEGKPQNVVTA